jgi:Uma2 family endonuclease
MSVYSLVEGEYTVAQFTKGDRIVSPTFPGFNLTAEQIFLAGRGNAFGE